MTDQADPQAAVNICEHHYETRILGGHPLSVRICLFCRTPDWADLRDQAGQIRDAARQAAGQPAADAQPITVEDLARALDNSTPYPIELDMAVYRFMAARLLEMTTMAKRPDHDVWQPEQEAACCGKPAGVVCAHDASPQPEPAAPWVAEGRHGPTPEETATGLRGLLEHVGIDTTGRDITVAGKTVDAARPAALPCNWAHGRVGHEPHDWKPQPGMQPVRCPGYSEPAEHVHKLGNADEDGGILDDWDNCRDPECPGPATPAAGQPAEAQPAEALVQVGWWCWRGDNHGHLATQACRSDNVPLHAPADWADDMRAVIQRIEDGEEDEQRADRAAILREAADAIDTETRALKRDEALEPHKFRPCRDASAQLRRMAEETPR